MGCGQQGPWRDVDTGGYPAKPHSEMQGGAKAQMR